jgi:hypothetical protein
MTQDVEMACIANATAEPKEHGEIEITLEMIDAGELAFVEHDPRFEGLKEAVVRIYLAMRQLEPR